MAFSGCERGTDGHKSDKLANDIRDGYAEVMARFWTEYWVNKHLKTGGGITILVGTDEGGEWNTDTPYMATMRGPDGTAYFDLWADGEDIRCIQDGIPGKLIQIKVLRVLDTVLRGEDSTTPENPTPQ